MPHFIALQTPIPAWGLWTFSTPPQELSAACPGNDNNSPRIHGSDPCSFYGTAASGVSVEQRNRAAQHLLAVSRCRWCRPCSAPWLGVQTGIARAMSPGIRLIVFLGGAFGFMFAIGEDQELTAGVPVLLGFTFFMGLMLARLIGAVLGYNGASLIMMAFARHRRGVLRHGRAVHGDQARPLGMASFSSSAPSWCWWRASPTSSAVERADADAVGAGDRHLLGLHPVRPKRVRDGYETNYISATLNVYLDIYNVFQGLLSLFGIAGSND